MRTSFLAAWIGWWIASSFAAAADPAPKLSANDRKRLQTITASFKKTKDDFERLDLIDAAARLGPVGLQTADDLVNSEFHPALQKYRSQLTRAASQAATRQLDQQAIPEIQSLRAKVLGLARGTDELTKEKIVSESDPALARLKILIFLDRAKLLEGNPALVKARESLFGIGEQWRRVREHYAAAEKATAKSASKPGEAPIEAPPFEDYLVRDEQQAIGLALPMSEETRAVFTANSALAEKLDPEEYRCITQVNLTRALLGLAPLAVDPALVGASRDHSNDMATKGFFSHESPVPGKTTPWDRAKNFGTSASGENIAAGTTDGAKANEMWWHSPGHHKNMLGDHKRVGVGKHGVHWTEMFGG